LKIKTTARKALPRVSAFYISDDRDQSAGKNLRALIAKSKIQGPNLPVFSSTNFETLITVVSEALNRSECAAKQTQFDRLAS